MSERCIHGYLKRLCPECKPATTSSPKLAKSQFVTQEAEKYGLAYAHRLKPIPELEKNEKERVWLASAIDHDGSIGETRTYSVKEKYWYKVPMLEYTTTTPNLAQKVSKLIKKKPTVEEPPPPRRTAYHFSIAWGHAITVILYIKPYLIRLHQKTNEILTKYKERPSIPVPTPTM